MASPVPGLPTNELLDPVTAIMMPGDKLPQILGRVRFTTGWQGFISSVGSVLLAITSSGTTAQRPTKGLFVGRAYFDTTLGKPIWLKSVGPVVWVDATGTPV